MYIKYDHQARDLVIAGGDTIALTGVGGTRLPSMVDTWIPVKGEKQVSICYITSKLS